MLSFSATQRTCSPQNTPDIRTHTNQAGDGARIDRRGHRTVAAPERLWAPAPGEKSHTTFETRDDHGCLAAPRRTRHQRQLRLALADLTWSGQDSRASCEGPLMIVEQLLVSCGRMSTSERLSQSGRVPCVSGTHLGGLPASIAGEKEQTKQSGRCLSSSDKRRSWTRPRDQ